MDSHPAPRALAADLRATFAALALGCGHSETSDRDRSGRGARDIRSAVAQVQGIIVTHHEHLVDVARRTSARDVMVSTGWIAEERE